MKTKNSIKYMTASSGLALLLLAPSAQAVQWGDYHWAGSAPLSLDVYDNLSTAYESSLELAVGAPPSGIGSWEYTGVLNMQLHTGGTNTDCNPVSGHIEVCNGAYGATGWLGLTQIWTINGSEIIESTSKINDSYFASAPYNATDNLWRDKTLCHELGHSVGLDHQDNDYSTNLMSCMDITADLVDADRYPNTADYQTLQDMYGSSSGGGSTTTTTSGGGKSRNKTSGGGGGGGGKGKNKMTALPPAFDGLTFDEPKQWGQVIRTMSNGLEETFDLDFGNGVHVLTNVEWVSQEEHDRVHPHNRNRGR